MMSSRPGPARFVQERYRGAAIARLKNDLKPFGTPKQHQGGTNAAIRAIIATTWPARLTTAANFRSRSISRARQLSAVPGRIFNGFFTVTRKSRSPEADDLRGIRLSLLQGR